MSITTNQYMFSFYLQVSVKVCGREVSRSGVKISDEYLVIHELVTGSIPDHF